MESRNQSEMKLPKRLNVSKTIQQEIWKELEQEREKTSSNGRFKQLKEQFDGREYHYNEELEIIESTELKWKQFLKLRQNDIQIEVLYVSINKDNWIHEGNKQLIVNEFVGRVMKKNNSNTIFSIGDYVIGRDMTQNCFKSLLITSCENVRKLETTAQSQMMNQLANLSSGTFALSIFETIRNVMETNYNQTKEQQTVLILGEGVVVKKLCDLLTYQKYHYSLLCNEELEEQYLRKGYTTITFSELDNLKDKLTFTTIVDFYNMKQELQKLTYQHYFSFTSPHLSTNQLFSYQTQLQRDYQYILKSYIHSIISLSHQQDLKELPHLIQQLEKEDKTIIISF